jgi:hypothetical protein
MGRRQFEAAVALSRLDFASIEEAASSGALGGAGLPPSTKHPLAPLAPFDAVKEAPDRPLSNREYHRWLRS